VLLRVGVVMMTIAVLFAGVVGVVVIVRGDPPEQAVAAKHDAAEAPEELASGSELEPESQPEPEPRQRSKPQRRPEPRPEPQPERQTATLPAPVEEWPEPKSSESDLINEPRHFEVPPGAIMSLTVEAIGIYNAPVFDSDSQWALDNGIIHVPQTSLPWSDTQQRNVYLAGHRLGYEGTGSRLIFYELDELVVGDEVVLEDREGKLYRYRVSETFVVGPADTWVMGEVRGRDMVTLQTCTPIPTFEQRIIVRADRV
jgi:sortase A